MMHLSLRKVGPSRLDMTSIGVIAGEDSPHTHAQKATKRECVWEEWNRGNGFDSVELDFRRATVSHALMQRDLVRSMWVQSTASR